MGARNCVPGARGTHSPGSQSLVCGHGSGWLGKAGGQDRWRRAGQGVGGITHPETETTQDYKGRSAPVYKGARSRESPDKRLRIQGALRMAGQQGDGRMWGVREWGRGTDTGLYGAVWDEG